MLRLISMFFFLVLILLIGCNSSSPQGGEGLYKQHCANCHMDSGKGLGTLMPPLAEADYFQDHRDQLACIIRNGMEGEIEVNGKTYNNAMKAYPELSEVDIVNILNYIRGSWNKDMDQFTLAEVKNQLDSCN